jgi:hypothetical protein
LESSYGKRVYAELQEMRAENAKKEAVEPSEDYEIEGLSHNVLSFKKVATSKTEE